MGKGVFNVFIGTLMIINANLFSYIIAGVFIFSGLLFIFLSKFRNMSDEQLQRAASIYADNLKKDAKKGATTFVATHKDDIANAAYDNREVIAQVAYEHRDSIANAAYDNKELLAETYIKA